VAEVEVQQVAFWRAASWQSSVEWKAIGPAPERPAPVAEVWEAKRPKAAEETRRRKMSLMLSHVVLMKPRADLSPAEGQALIDAFERAMREIPDVRGVRVGRRVRHGAGYEHSAPDSADYLVTIDFDDLAGLQAYLRHPAHDALGASFNKSLRSALVYDFEVGGLERLANLR
jgi:Stress responsive A/B Barrel Domain